MDMRCPMTFTEGIPLLQAMDVLVKSNGMRRWRAASKSGTVSFVHSCPKRESEVDGWREGKDPYD